MPRKNAAQLDLELPVTAMMREPLPEAPAPRRVRLQIAPARPAWQDRLRRVLLLCALAAALGLLALALWSVDRFLSADSRFALRHAPAITGLVHTPRARIEAVFARDLGRSVYLVPLEQRCRELRAVDWVREAGISRIWPDRLAVRIVERTPVAFLVDPHGKPSLIDAEGEILTLPPRARLEMPALTGVSAAQPGEVRQSRMQQVSALLAQTKDQGKLISEIDITNPRNLKVTYLHHGRPFRLWLGSENYGLRLNNFLKFYGEISRRLPGASTFDLSLDDRITVPGQPEGDLGAPAARSQGPAPAKKSAVRQRRQGVR